MRAYENRLPVTDEEIRTYILGLKPGERVVETGVSGLQGRQGTVYENSRGDVCVLWDRHHDEPPTAGRMGSTVTWGARRVMDVILTYRTAVSEVPHCHHPPHFQHNPHVGDGPEDDSWLKL